MAEPIKCENCGGLLYDDRPPWDYNARWRHVRSRHEECNRPDVAVPALSQEARADSAISINRIREREGLRPPLPTSREWLGEDGDDGWATMEFCAAEVSDTGHDCIRRSGHEGHHTCGGVATLKDNLCGRWYDDGPFVEAE